MVPQASWAVFQRLHPLLASNSFRTFRTQCLIWIFAGRFTRNGPLFLSDTESDTEEEEEETRTTKDQEKDFHGRPPPSYPPNSKELGPSCGMLTLDSRTRRAMQNLWGSGFSANYLGFVWAMRSEGTYPYFGPFLPRNEVGRYISLVLSRLPCSSESHTVLSVQSDRLDFLLLFCE